MREHQPGRVTTLTTLMRIQEHNTISSCISQVQEDNLMRDLEKINQEPETNPSWEGFEKFFATEVIEQSKKNAKRWFIAWAITLAALIATNTYWIYVFNSYEYVDQYGDGVNNVNTGSQGDLTNEPESTN